LRIRPIEPRAWDQVRATGSVCDRLIWMRFLGLGLGGAIPDANTIWTFREALTKAGATLRLFELFDQEPR
jgi:Transposase domain (DUF772)